MREDDDVIIILYPQNVQGGEVITLLDEMCASSKARDHCHFNQPFSEKTFNDNMQIRGRAERRAVQDFFRTYSAEVAIPQFEHICIQ